MEPHVATTPMQPPLVTMARIKAALEQVPVDQLGNVYEYLISLLEEAEDIAAINTAQAEMQHTGNVGMPLEDYLREQGLLDEVEALAKSETLTDE
jgi:hypothetical protein